MVSGIKAKVITGSLGLLSASVFGYTIAYPYTREIYMCINQINEADGFTVKKIDNAAKKLQENSEFKSLLKKYLTNEVKDKLKYKRTKLNASLYDVICSGVKNSDANIGVYAADAESYKTFGLLFNPIIKEYHKFTENDIQPPVDLGLDHLSEFVPLDPEGKYIKSTRIRCARTLKGYPFNPLLTADDYLIIQEKIKIALSNFKDNDLKGTYYPLDEMTKEVQDRLIKDHFLFKEDDRHLKEANAYNYWPKGRGIFHNDDKTFLIWVNEEDHIRIISMENGSDVGKVLERLIRGINIIEKEIPFARDERLGWLTFCPTNLGSTVRASVHICLPKLSAKNNFNEICDKLNLQVRGIHGEHSDSVDSVYDISNKARLGLSEYQAIKQMYDGVKELIMLEENERENEKEN